MATITATNMQGGGVKAVTETTLTGTDTFSYSAFKRPVLLLRNPTGGSLTVNIDGAGATTVAVPGVGNVNIADGYSTGAIGAGASRAIELSTIEKYLQGVIAVTGGNGIVASLLEF